jgi:cyclophilin family peptidyl-prolyl cis-trans isomerase
MPERALIAFACAALFATNVAAAPFVKIATTKGDVIVELDSEKAPLTVANFLEYAEAGHYDRTLIHRVVNGVLFQGGGFGRGYIERPTRDPVANEGANGLKNLRGTIAMARGPLADSATSQWYVNLIDHAALDHRNTPDGPVFGYAVFGRIVEGMAVADAIGAVATGAGGPIEGEVPIEPIFVLRVDVVEAPPSLLQ